MSSEAPPSCTTAAPDHYGYVPPDACNANYGFYPSWNSNLAFTILFGATALTHVVQAASFRKAFCVVIIMGALWETIAFLLRTLGAHDQQNSNYVIYSTLLFLLAPLWINAFVYMVVARLTYYMLPERRLLGIQAFWLAKLFIVADIISFVIQAAGGAMLADSNDLSKVADGQRIYMAGIGVQLFFVLIFMVFGAALARRLVILSRTSEAECKGRWVWPLTWSVIAALALIVLRIGFRFAEFSMGVSASNPLLKSEWYQLLLDGLPMLIALLLFNGVHPGKVLKGPESSFPSGAWKWWKQSGANNSIPLDSVCIESPSSYNKPTQ